jgi:hypothetical protein
MSYGYVPCYCCGQDCSGIPNSKYTAFCCGPCTYKIFIEAGESNYYQSVNDPRMGHGFPKEVTEWMKAVEYIKAQCQSTKFGKVENYLPGTKPIHNDCRCTVCRRDCDSSQEKNCWCCGAPL